MTSSQFNVYGRYYDLLYRDKDYDREAAYVDSLLQRHDLTGAELLEFGSGTGMHGRLLAARGYHVTGIERSPEMLSRSLQGPGFECQLGDARHVRLGRRFDAVLALFHVVSYQTANADVHAIFANASAHLDSGGLFVFDIWYSPAVYAQRPQVRVKRMVDAGLCITRIAEPATYPNENRVDVNYTVYAHDASSGNYGTFEETHPMRHFSLPELDAYGGAVSLERLAAEEFLTGKAPGEDTWGVCLVMRKT